VDWHGGPEKTYTVVTFSGMLAKVAEANLTEFTPLGPERGGFDCAWPAGAADSEAFAMAVAEHIANKGYCVIQTYVDREERKDALATANTVKEHEEYRMEIEADFMGKNNSTKVKKLAQDTPDSFPEDALGRCNHQLTELGLLLFPLVPSYLGFNASAHSKAVARVKFSSKSEMEKMKPPPLFDDDVEEGFVKNHILFLQTRKLSFLYMVENEGGELVLHPKEGDNVTLPVEKNRIVLFRHDDMTYSYKPAGEHLAVQAWMLGDMPSYQLKKIEGDLSEKLDLMGVVGPKAPEGLRAQITTMRTRLPGDSTEAKAYYSMACLCTDTCTKWPLLRFDEDAYYSPDPNDVIFGKAYTNHGGFLSFEQVTSLDNDFFDISPSEAHAMSMNQRMWTEIGYETLWSQGLDKQKLNGCKVGTYLGDVGSDWHSNTKDWSMYNWVPDHTAMGVNSAIVPCRLHYVFGMIGPTMTFDTACSASLVAAHSAHIGMLNFHQWNIETDGALVGGVNSIGVSGHIGNCQGNILTHNGRCFTFDEAADGYQRGEGCAAFFLQITADKDTTENRLGCMVGSVSSHDGKSASLTAPSGPAQQVMLKHSLRFSGLEPEDICFTECHGTGTALGDPIEMGAVAAVYVEDRETPLPHTTPKTNLGHLESCAGVSGLLRCLLSLLHGLCPPNVHFRKLNPHVDMEGYPRIFQSELVETGLNAAYSGASSFGFGGANARCDLYAIARMGPAAKPELEPEKLDFVSVPCPSCMGCMCFRCGVAIPTMAAKGPHRCSMLRDEFADYEVCSNCYAGNFRYGLAVEDLDTWSADIRVFARGTWTAFTSLDEMEPDGDGNYTMTVVLGESRAEQFHLLTNQGTKLFPPVKRSRALSRVIVGSSEEGKRRNWLINGIEDGAPARTHYQVTLAWGDQRQVSWKKIESEEAPAEEPVGGGFLHRYFISGSWIQWESRELSPKPGFKGQYEIVFRLGRTGFQEFYFTRDRDDMQRIHPARPKAESPTVPIHGPDESGAGKNFVIRGRKQEAVTLNFKIEEGKYTVEASLEESGKSIVWESDSGLHTYGVTGTFNNWGLTPMVVDQDQPGVHKCRVMFQDYGDQEFQIVMDEDLQLLHYPAIAGALSGEGILQGPDDMGEGLCWGILDAHPGFVIEITLDFSRPDRRKRVTWAGVPQLTDAPRKY